MERVLLKLLVITTLVTIAASERCWNPQTCTDSDCPYRFTCLMGICYKCGCKDNATQCYLEDKRWACNCTGSGGYYGTDCKCPPLATESCTDKHSIYSSCQQLSDSFMELQGLRIHIEEGDGFPTIFHGYDTNYTNCKAKCLEFDCHVHGYGGDDCVVFSKNVSMPLENVLFRFRNATDYSVYVRECDIC